MDAISHMPLPPSAVVLGLLVNALQLQREPGPRAVLATETARRFFRGERIKEQSAEDIIDAISSALLSAGYLRLPQSATADTSRSPLAAALRSLCVRWDECVGIVSSTTAGAARDAVFCAFLRQLTLELALRWVALRKLHELPPPPDDVPVWATEDGWAAPVRRAAAAAASRGAGTLAAFTEALALNAQKTVENWLYARARPSEPSLVDLARTLADAEPASTEEENLAHLRRHFALSALCDALAERVGREDVGDMATAMARITRTIMIGLQRSKLPPDVARRAQFTIFEGGSAYAPAHDLLRHAARNEQIATWRAELLGLLDDPVQRLRCVALNAVHVESGTRTLQREFGLTAEAADGLARLVQRLGPAPDVMMLRGLAPEIREKLLADPKVRASFLASEAQAHVNARDFAAAVTAFRAAAKFDGQNFELHFRLGAALHLAGRPSEALVELEIAHQLDPRQFLPQVEIAIVHLDQGDTDLALERLESLAQTFPEEAHVHYHLGIARMRKHQWQQALDAFEAVIARQPLHAMALDLAAHCAFMTGSTAKGADYAKRAAALGHHDTHTAWRAGAYKKAKSR